MTGEVEDIGGRPLALVVGPVRSRCRWRMRFELQRIPVHGQRPAEAVEFVEEQQSGSLRTLPVAGGVGRSRQAVGGSAAVGAARGLRIPAAAQSCEFPFDVAEFAVGANVRSSGVTMGTSVSRWVALASVWRARPARAEAALGGHGA